MSGSDNSDGVILGTDYSTFDRPPPLSSSAMDTDNPDAECSLITLLAVAQDLQIPFLPTTWEPEEAMVGEGGTSQVNQAQATKSRSLVFKRVSVKAKLDDPVERVYRRIINEIMVLHHPAVRTHPNTLELLGLTWEFSADRSQGNDPTQANQHDKYKVWPVLVFEKTAYGDLYQFSKLPIAKELDTIDRIKICIDIGAAIGHMQSSHVAHGDIKPQNVLIFTEKQTGFFLAKVADFGFSAAYSDDDLRIVPIGTALWSAPEVSSYPDLSRAQAMTSDVFSFGMLCLWFIFERYLSGELLLPSTLPLNPAPQLYREEHRSLHFLKHLKEKDYLAEFAIKLVDAQIDLSEKTKQSLRQFFIGSLNPNPLSRDTGIVHALRHLDINLSQDVVVPPIDKMFLPVDDGFNLCHSLGIYYMSDFRIRSAILQSLEATVAKYAGSPLSRQLAFCYELGFGHSSSHTPNQRVMYDEQEIRAQLRDAARDELKELDQQHNPRNRVVSIHQVSLGLIVGEYLQQGLLETAEQTTRHEIVRMETSVGACHLSEVVLRHFLAGIVEKRGNWEEAQTLREQVAEVTIRSLGRESLTTLTNMGELASIYHSRGSFKRAEELELEILDLGKKLLGAEHPETLAITENLAVTLYDQGRLHEAQKLLLDVVGAQRNIFGPEHPSTVSAMGHLAAVLSDQGSTQEALNWASQAMEICQRKLGLEHPDTVDIMEIMVRIHIAEHRFEEAEQIQTQSLKTRTALLGDEHPERLTSMYNLAVIYNHMGKHSNAQRLLTTCAELQARVLGREHSNTRASIRELEGTIATIKERPGLQASTADI